MFAAGKQETNPRRVTKNTDALSGTCVFVFFMTSVCVSIIQFPVKHENVNCQEEYHCDGNNPVEDQNEGELIQNQSEQACGKGNNDQTQQQPTFHSQLPAVGDGMDDAQQQEKDGGQLVNMDSGQGHHDRNNKAGKPGLLT